LTDGSIITLHRITLRTLTIEEQSDATKSRNYDDSRKQAGGKANGHQLNKSPRALTKRVIISPDGELNFVSFATLLTPDK
jgi:hypothetical protein